MVERDGTRLLRRGKVWLVGAGPGDPALLTVKAHRLVSAARVLAYDELVSPEILALAPVDAERTAVGRRGAGCRHHEARIHPAVLLRALAGQDVVRLKGGDPLVFGRGGEEAEELSLERVPFEIVPGISAALGAAASAGIPLTHRDVASSVTFVTAHAASASRDLPEGASAHRDGTIVFYMGLGRLEITCQALVSSGRAGATPAAVISRATLPGQRIVVGTLEDIASRVRDRGLEAPALLVVGEVVARRVTSPALVAYNQAPSSSVSSA